MFTAQCSRPNVHGPMFTAQCSRPNVHGPSPEGVGSEKYDATSASMVALLKYGSGLPFTDWNEMQILTPRIGLPTVPIRFAGRR